MKKVIGLMMNFLVLSVLLVLVLGPAFGCGSTASKNTEPKRYLDEQNISCDQVLTDRVESSLDTKDRLGVINYEFNVEADRLAVMALDYDDEVAAIASFSSPELNGPLGQFQYEDENGYRFGATHEVFYLEKNTYRSVVEFYDSQTVMFQVWMRMHVSSVSGVPAKIEAIHLVAPVIAGQQIDSGTIVNSRVSGKLSVLAVYQEGEFIENEAIERFVEQSGIYSFIHDGAFAEFDSYFSDPAILEKFSGAAEYCDLEQTRLKYNQLKTRQLPQSLECNTDDYNDALSATKHKMVDVDNKAATTSEDATVFTAVGGAMLALGTLAFGSGSMVMASSGVIAGAMTFGGGLVLVLGGVALIGVGIYYFTKARGQRNLSRDLHHDIINLESQCAAGNDPYFHTLGGLAYPFQTPGQFVLLERPSDPGFALQIHQKTEYFETCSPGALIKTAALQLGRHRVVFDSGGGDVITVDGISREFNRQAIELDGGVIHEIGTGEYRVEWDSGERADISVYVDHLDLQIKVVDEYMSEYRGLLGQHTTAEEGALQLRDARVLDGPVAWETLHGSFADSWRVRANESLFNDIEVVTPLSPMPHPHRLDEIGVAAQARAVQACTQAGIVDGNLMHHCVLDVGCSGDVTYAQSYTQFPAPKRVLPLDLRQVTQSTSVDLSHTTMANLDASRLNDLRTVQMPATNSCGSAGSGDSAGDPHLRTLDGLAYDLQAVGEFVLVEAFAGKPLQIQVRQQPEPGSRCANVSYNTAVAARLGGYRVTVDSRRAKPLWINGAPSDVPAGFLPLENGDGIFEVSAGHYRFRWADNSLLDIKISHGHLSLATLLPDTRLGQVHGLLGRYNGDLSDDLSLRDGTILSQPVKWFDLYEQFAQSWRIAPEESLFDYETGESTETFSDESAPSQPTTLDDLPDDGRAVARQTCEDAGITDAGLLDDCTMDVYCTGEDSYADVHARRAPADAQVDLLMPIFLDGWLQQGESANGNWVVSDNGRSVTQTVNGDPTFFVSPEDYFDTTIRGTFQVDTGSDDDFIGFVFGYQAPFEESGDATNDFKTFVLSWKQGEQIDAGGLAEEGLTLAYINGALDAPAATLWGHEEISEYQVLATHYGEGRGWADFTPIEFTLEYGSERIRIWIDEELIFDVSAAQAGVPFETGRFGFYNFSQSDVIYSDFNVR